MIVDTHTHVIARDEARYPLRPSGVGSQWFRDAPCTADELAALTADAGVGAAVLVQAFGAYSYDNSYVLFERVGPKSFRLSLAEDGEEKKWRSKSIAQRNHFRFTGGREYGFFS